jgi:predicted TIM-barrel fold metal-dependent hydrolase
MDSGLEQPRELKQLGKASDTRETLAHAKRAVLERGLDEWLVVDVDAHHFENQSWSEVIAEIPSDVVRDIAHSFVSKGQVHPGIMQSSGWPPNQSIGGRVSHDQGLEELAESDDGAHRDVVLIRRAMECMAIDYQITFPTPMLSLGLHPEVEVEVGLAEGYNRWLTDRILSTEDGIYSMLYLPFSDPEACERIVEQYGDHPKVSGFMITSVRYKPVHHNQYMRLYRMIEERGKTLGFHAGPNWQHDGYVGQLNRFISMHAITFVLCNIIHMTNWVINGLPERFPNLPVLWIESGLSWLPFMQQRLDSEYLMRSSEAPNLKRLPSEYIAEMFFTCQPMERTNMKLLEGTFEAIKAPTQLLYASDWPHWDFDLPTVITDLPFIDEQAKRNILGHNAAKLFGLDTMGK